MTLDAQASFVVKLPADYRSLEPYQRRMVREAYVEQQGGKCHFCKAPLSHYPPKEVTSKTINWKRFPKNFLKWPVHLHHHHVSGLTIGAVHAYCNAVLWQYHGE
jgi:hypothetical protein